MTRHHRRWLIALVPALLAGCGTIIGGTTQRIEIGTAPPGADCGVYRRGVLVARVPATPGAVRVDRNRTELMVLCVKPGSLPQTAFLRATPKLGLLENTGNALLGAGPGWAIDSETDAALRYDQPKQLVLPPDTQGRPETLHRLPESLNDAGPSRKGETLPTR